MSLGFAARPEQLQDLEREALRVVAELAEMGRAAFAAFEGDVESKSDGSPVTETDRAIEQRARMALASVTPAWGFSGEEFGALRQLDQPDAPGPLNFDEDTYWICDPIDGTRCFVSRVPTWSTLLALVWKGEPVLGIVALPCLGEVFIASRGNGTRWGRIGADPQTFLPCRTSGASHLATARLSCSAPDTFAERGAESWYLRLLAASGRIRTDSDAFGYTRVLLGACDAMLDPIVAPHDVAAVQILLQECPGAFCASLHGDSSAAAFRRGSFVAAASEELGRVLLLDYWSHMAEQRNDFSVSKAFSDEDFSVRYARSGVPFSAERTEMQEWGRALEIAVADFKLREPASLVEDVAIIAEAALSLDQRFRNGRLAAEPVFGASEGVQVRAVVDGGAAMVSRSLPVQENLVDLIVETMDLALADAREGGFEPGWVSLATRPWVRGHFGNVPWDADFCCEEFPAIADAVRTASGPLLASPISFVESEVDVSLVRRAQWFLDGAFQTVAVAQSEVRIAVVADEGEESRMAERRWFTQGFATAEDLAAAVSSEGAEARAEVTSLLEAPYAPANLEYDYLALDRHLQGLILHEALGHALEGDFADLAVSALASADSPVMPPWLSVVADPAHTACGYSPVDWEGTPGVRKLLVENGKVKDFLNTRATAHKLRGVPDGSAIAESTYEPPLNRMTNLWIQPAEARSLAGGGTTLERLRQALSADGTLRPGVTVLFLTGWRGGMATISNLEFRLDVSFAYRLTSDGEPEVLRSVCLMGNARECFHAAVAAYGEPVCDSLGLCEKEGQSVPTSDGGPEVLLLRRHAGIRLIGTGEAES